MYFGSVYTMAIESGLLFRIAALAVCSGRVVAVRVWDRALSPQEVKALAEASKSNDQPKTEPTG